MISGRQILQPTVRKCAQRAALDERDREALFNLPFELRTVEANRTIVREGDRPDVANLLLDGLAFRHKLTVEGARQILSVHVPGDLLDINGLLLQRADHNVQTLTACAVAAMRATQSWRCSTIITGLPARCGSTR